MRRRAPLTRRPSEEEVGLGIVHHIEDHRKVGRRVVDRNPEEEGHLGMHLGVAEDNNLLG